jgi:PAS domain-containing protein
MSAQITTGEDPSRVDDKALRQTPSDDASADGTSDTNGEQPPRPSGERAHRQARRYRRWLRARRHPDRDDGDPVRSVGVAHDASETRPVQKEGRR